MSPANISPWTAAAKAALCLILAAALTGQIGADARAGGRPAAAAEGGGAKHSGKALIGDDVPVQIWRDEAITPWAVLLCIHGLSLHSASFEPFGKAMSHLGVPTYAMDVRGFGNWQRTDEAAQLNFDETLSDIRNTIQAVRRSNPGLPLIIVGESMGGALALQAAAANPDLVDGLICSVPSKSHTGQKGTDLKAALGLIYFPNTVMAVGDKVIKRATQQDRVAADWENDPMARKEFTPKELYRFHNLMAANKVRAQQITHTPVLFLQGGSDKLIKPAGTVDLFNHLKTPDKDLVMVGTAEHLILEEGQFSDTVVIKDDVISLITNWIDKHVVNPVVEKAGSEQGNTIEKQGDTTRMARGHFKIAEGQILLNDADSAKSHLLEVMQLARGTALAQKADELLLSLPEHLIAPPVGTGQHDNAHLVSLNSAKENDKPSILVFCAPWIESCKTVLEDVKMALGPDHDKVNLVWINADKEETQPVVKEYGIGPLPAILYLSTKNEVLLYTLGDPGVPITRSRIRKLLAADAKLQGKPIPAEHEPEHAAGHNPEHPQEHATEHARDSSPPSPKGTAENAAK